MNLGRACPLIARIHTNSGLLKMGLGYTGLEGSTQQRLSRNDAVGKEAIAKQILVQTEE